MVTTPRQSDDTAGAAREPGLTALAGQLTRELRSLVERLRHFSAARWAAAAPPFSSRAEVAFHLAQVLAAASLAAAGMPARVLPGAGSGKAAVAEFQRRGRERCRWA